MKAAHKGDRAVDAWLRRAALDADGQPATPACLDAETAASWLENGLDDQARDAALAHTAGCARCQALMRTLSDASATASAQPQHVASPARAWFTAWWAWASPVAAVAVLLLAVVLWRQSPSPSSSPEASPASASPRATLRDDERLLAARAPSAPPATAAAQPQAPPSPAARAALSAPQPAAAPPPPGPLRETVVMRIDAGPAAGLSRWAIVAGRLLRTDDNWVTFRVVGVSGVSGVAAAACPAADTCWVLGSPAIVARTTDGGRNWTRLPVPGASVLVGIDATDAAHARVRTADGRTLQTDDSGATWK